MLFKRLGDYVSIKTGKLDANASEENGIYPFFTCAIDNLLINTYAFECECVLVAGNGDLNVKYFDGRFNAYQRTYIIESLNKTVLDVKYLYYFMSKHVDVLRRNSVGGVIKYIKLGDLTEQMIQLPPIKTQRKIVEALDKAKSLIDVRKEQIRLMDKLIKSRFIEVFGNPVTNSKGWIVEELSKCLINIENGKSFVCENYSRKGEHPAILKLSAVTYGIYNSSENKALTDEDMFVESVEVKKGDLLFTRKNTPELVGMSAYVYETSPNLMMPDLIFRLNTNEKCNKVYLWKLINHDLFRENIKALSNGSAKSMSNISKQRLMSLKIQIPPIELQNQFADFVNQVDKLKFEAQNSLEELNISYKALLQAYFGC
ncbi:MAG: restriction endonuclease subunit S [Bacillota bacterium]|nr:restriction endonuclease subunit S [Bacillota bacterium]